MSCDILGTNHRLQCYLNPFFIAHLIGWEWGLPSVHGDEQHSQHKPGCVRVKANIHILCVMNVRMDLFQKTD